MKTVLFGTSGFAVPALHALADATNLAAVVTQPDRPAGRGHRLAPTPVKEAALERGLIVFEPERLRPFVAPLAELTPDAIVVASYGKILPQALLDVPRLAAFNIHPSLLPLYRGATPIQSAIRDGRSTTGVTIIAMDAGMDTGDILLQETTPLGPHETYGVVHDRLAFDGARLLIDVLRSAESGTLPRQPQASMNVDEAEINATLTHPLRAEDLALDCTGTAKRAVDQIRSLAPQPLARIRIDDETVKIVDAHAIDESRLDATLRASAPGSVHIRTSVFVRCVQGGIALDRLIAPGRGTMDGGAYAQRAVARAARSEADR